MRLRALAPGVVGLRIATDERPWVDAEAVRELRAAVAQLRSDPSVRAVVVEGGERHFCSGAPREMLLAPNAAERLGWLVRELPLALLDLPVPAIAAMAGHAVGGGWLAGLWCPLVLMSASSLYGANFVTLGLTPGMGATRRLPALLGEPLAWELMATGRLMKGRELLERAPQLAGVVLPRDEVLDRAIALGLEIAAADPGATRLLASHHAALRREELFAALASERPMHDALLASPSTARAIAEAYPTREEP